MCETGRSERRFRHHPCRARLAPGTAPGALPELPGFAACAGCSSLRGRGMSCTPAHSATAPGCHRGRSVDSATRSGAGSQLSRDCSAPWQGNDRAQRVPVSPRKSCSAWRDITWISSGRKRLGADRACKYREKRLAWGSSPHSPAALGLVGRAWSRMEMENWSRMEMENQSRMELENLHGKWELEFLLPKFCA